MKTTSAKRWYGLSIWAMGFVPGQRFCAWLPAYRREIVSLCGPLGLGVPIIVEYRGRSRKRRAQGLARRIRDLGYKSARIQREREREHGLRHSRLSA